MNDAIVIKKYLVKSMGFVDKNIIYLKNPTSGELTRVFGTEKDYKGQLYNWVKKGKSDVFVYYAGHGAPDIDTGEPYIVPADVHPDYVKQSGYPLRMLYQNLNKMEAKSITVVLDACFSGSSEKGMLIAKASPLGLSMAMEAPQKINLLCAANKGEIASWYPEKKHSLFTYFFLKALQGCADKNKDEIITLDEVEEYTVEKVADLARREYNRKQYPQLLGDKKAILIRGLKK